MAASTADVKAAYSIGYLAVHSVATKVATTVANLAERWAATKALLPAAKKDQQMAHSRVVDSDTWKVASWVTSSVVNLAVLSVDAKAAP